MRRLAINVTICLVSFAVGVASASVLTWLRQPLPGDPPRVKVEQVKDQPPSTVVPISEEPLNPEVVFAGGSLRIVPADVNLKSERLRYEIAVTYPQIVGSKASHIRKLNQKIKQLVNKEYEGLLNPTKADLRYYREKWPEVFNSVYINYEIPAASDSFLSIYFNGYSYGIGAAHAVQFSLVVNYDLALQKEVRLPDIFTSRSNYLDFISQYCTKELLKQPEGMFEDALPPDSAYFKSWNITRAGIRFNFDACSVFACAYGEKEVEIPFADLKKFLNARALTTIANRSLPQSYVVSRCVPLCGFTRTATPPTDRLSSLASPESNTRLTRRATDRSKLKQTS